MACAEAYPLHNKAESTWHQRLAGFWQASESPPQCYVQEFGLTENVRMIHNPYPADALFSSPNLVVSDNHDTNAAVLGSL